MNTPRFHLPTPLPYWRFCFPPVDLAAFRYYEGSDSRRTLITPTGLPAYLVSPSEHSAPNHLMHPDDDTSTAVYHPTLTPTGLGKVVLASTRAFFGRLSGFAIYMQARRCTLPKRVRHPTDCSFASGCSPPHVAVTQLPPATRATWPPLVWTLTSLTTRLHGRTYIY